MTAAAWVLAAVGLLLTVVGAARTYRGRMRFNMDSVTPSSSGHPTTMTVDLRGQGTNAVLTVVGAVVAFAGTAVGIVSG